MMNIATRIIFCLLLCFFYVSHSKTRVLIFTFAYNRPDFIELQHRLFKKFLKDEYEFVAFDDSKDNKTTNDINSVCKKYNIKYVKVPQEVHSRPYLHRVASPWCFSEYNAPSVRNCSVVQYALDILGFSHDDLLILLESDVFLIKEFSFTKYMQNCDIAGYDRSKEYNDNRKNLGFLWIGLIHINMGTLTHKHAINVNCGRIGHDSIDSGGYLHYYLSNNPQTRIKCFEKLMIENFICKECKKNKSYRCNHNTYELQECGFDSNTIQFIQKTPIDWGSGVNRPNGGMTRRNIEFLNDNHFVHFYGASGYADLSSTCDIVQFYKDKTNAFANYINIILQS